MSDPCDATPAAEPRKCVRCGRVMLIPPGGTTSETCWRCRDESQPVESAASWSHSPVSLKLALVVAMISVAVSLPTTWVTLAMQQQAPVGPVAVQHAQPQQVVAPQANDGVPMLLQRLAAIERRLHEAEQRIVGAAIRRNDPAHAPIVAVKAQPVEVNGEGENAAKVRELEEKIETLTKLVNAHSELLLQADKNVREAFATGDKNLKETFLLADRNVKAALLEADKNVRNALADLVTSDLLLEDRISNLQSAISTLRTDVSRVSQSLK